MFFISYQIFLGYYIFLVNILYSFTQEHILKEKKEQEEREQKLRKMIVDEKIQNWLQIKREQVKKAI